MILTLRARNDLPAKSILYGWNPLVIKVFAGSGHIDAVLVAALAGACYFLARKRPTAASVSLGLAIAAKFAPIVLLPFLARRVGLWRAVLVVIVCVACFLPYLGAGAHLFDGLLAFSGKWQFNSGSFRLFASLMPDPLARITCAILIAMTIFFLYRRDSADPDTFCGVATLARGYAVVCHLAVAAWHPCLESSGDCIFSIGLHGFSCDGARSRMAMGSHFRIWFAGRDNRVAVRFREG